MKYIVGVKGRKDPFSFHLLSMDEIRSFSFRLQRRRKWAACEKLLETDDSITLFYNKFDFISVHRLAQWAMSLNKEEEISTRHILYDYEKSSIIIKEFGKSKKLTFHDNEDWTRFL